MKQLVKETGVVELTSELAKTLTSGSCILLNENTAVTTGLILLNHISEIKDYSTFFKDGRKEMSKKWFANLNVTLTLETIVDSQILPNKVVSISSEAHNDSTQETFTNKNIEVSGKILGMFKNNDFERSLKSLMPPASGWHFTDETDDDKTLKKLKKLSKVETLTQALIPYFLLIKICSDITVKPSAILRDRIHKGDGVSIVATPFGSVSCRTFMNSVSRGLVSNVANHVILSDARCVPGCEGGALYYHNGGLSPRALAGIIIAPFCWKNKEWIGLTLVCSISSVISSLQKQFSLTGLKRQIAIRWSEKSRLSDLCNSVPIVKVCNSWGSGILLGQDLIVTCRHVINGISPTVGFSTPAGMVWRNSKVLFKSARSSIIDLAILRLSSPVGVNESMGIPALSVNEGDAVYSIGYSLFDDGQDIGPSISRGHINKVLRSDGADHTAVMLQSSCAVHAGMSGGPLVSDDGTVVGMLVCNTKDTEVGASYPHVNMSIPMNIIKDFVNVCNDQEEDMSAGFDRLLKEYETKLSVWNLKSDSKCYKATETSTWSSGKKPVLQEFYKMHRIVSRL